MQIRPRFFYLRLARIALLFALLCVQTGGSPARAAPPAQEPQPEMPAAPGDHLVTSFLLTPDTPNVLRTNENVSLSFQYITNEPNGVYIWARPFTNGALTPGYGAHGSPLYPMGSGPGSGSFTITSGEVVVDQIRIQMWNSSQTQLLFETFLPVYYLFTDADHAVTNISLFPDTPDVLGFDQDANLEFSYITRQVGGVYIWARPFTNGSLTPQYAAHGSPVYGIGGGAGSGSFTITGGNVVVDHIRIQMWDTTQTTLLFEVFLPVYYRFMEMTNIVDHIDFSLDTPNVFKYSDDVNLNFNYTTNWKDGVRIWARPFSGSNLSPGYAAHPSGVYPAGSGSGSGFFSLISGPVVVDHVRIQMWGEPNQSVLLYEAFLPVNLLWAGAGPPPGHDMQVNAIEVTQAIQDLNNSVELVAGKRTYVRLHVNSPVNQNDVYATLSGWRGWTYLNPVLSPGNPGGDITVRASPDRGQINDSFWFELPASWTNAGSLTLIARLDPNGAKFDPDASDNLASLTVNFLETPPLRLRLVNVQYTSGGNTYLESNSHLDALESWLRRAYPINNLEVTRQTFVYPTNGLPNVDTLHGWLALGKIFRMLFSGEDSRVVYYGVVDDGGGFMRGKSAGIPSTIAAGPSGSGDWGWDFDGSYNDWYGGHEIGHTRGRLHAMFCGAADGGAYPYTNGRISPALSGNTAIYGFDITTRAIYGPDWKDVMTYCNNQWVSDFTYEGIRSYLAGVGLQAERAQMVTASEFLAVVGMADLDAHTASLVSVYQLTQDATVPLPDPGDWTIALLDATNAYLATYDFIPDELTDNEESLGHPAVIAEVVPWAAGTARVEIRYLGSVVAARNASANPPSVTITAPGGGVLLPDDAFDLTWSASDLDGDPLKFSVLYSNDNGLTWQTLATDVQGSSLALDTDQLPGGSSALLRVIASDGLLSAQATSGVFSVPLHAPSASITLPAENQVFYPTQQVVLQGSAYDLEDGSLGDSAFHWSSSINGDLGSGATLSTAVLSTGVHILTLTVTDSDAMSTQVQRTIEISAAGVPETVNLDVAPKPVGVVAVFGQAIDPYAISLRTSGETEINWTASEDIPWLTVSLPDGATPSDVTLGFDATQLNVGVHSGVVTFTSVGAENSPVELVVTVQVTGYAVHLPYVQR